MILTGREGILKNAEVKKILNNTAEYVESEEFFSWEQYFTGLLVSVTKESYLKYNKKKLNAARLQPSVKKKILDFMETISFVRNA